MEVGLEKEMGMRTQMPMYEQTKMKTQMMQHGRTQQKHAYLKIRRRVSSDTRSYGALPFLSLETARKSWSRLKLCKLRADDAAASTSRRFWPVRAAVASAMAQHVCAASCCCCPVALLVHFLPSQPAVSHL